VRQANCRRQTGETEVEVVLGLDGSGRSAAATGVGFLDHMLAAWARHALCDLQVRARGDLEVDAHHTVEDVGLTLGRAVREALGDRAGIRRYGWALVPMDESLAQAVVDFSGRPYLAWEARLPAVRVGSFPTELAQEFWRAFAVQAAATVHIRLLAAGNAHHALEAAWKAMGLACRQAWEVDPRIVGPLSTKGTLDG
jgi:imidazoleglycerol-phosphate dehydratase